MAVTWITCYRKRVAHAVPADVHSPAYRAHGLIEAVCGITVYPLRIAEASVRRCQRCTEKLPLGTSGGARRDGEWTVAVLGPLPTPRSGE